MWRICVDAKLLDEVCKAKCIGTGKCRQDCPDPSGDGDCEIASK